MPAGEVVVRLNLNKDGYSAGMTAARKQAQQLGDSFKELQGHTVSSMQASSAAIRVLEGGMTGNIRAAERFISMMPAVGKALQVAFPLVGGIALAGVFVRIGEEAAKAIEKVQRMPQAIENSFRAFNAAGKLANDSLDITNDKLAQEIAKLEGKPQNNLKLGLDEARQAADKLAQSLDADNQRIAKMMEENHLGAVMGLIMNKQRTAPTEGAIGSYNQKLSDQGFAASNVDPSDKVAVAKAAKDIADTLVSASAWVKQRLSEARTQQQLYETRRDNAAHGVIEHGAAASDQSANIAELSGFQTAIQVRQHQQASEALHVQLEAQKEALDSAKEAQEAAKRAAEAMKAAQEAIVAQWRKNLEEQKADNDMTLAQEAQFWVQRMESAKKGSLSYLAALSEVNRDIAKMRGENVRGQGQFDATSAGSYSIAGMDLSRGDTGAEKEQGRQSAEYIHALNDQIAAQHQAANAVAEQSLEMAVATGQMSRLDAAQVRATMHTEDYARAQEKLQTALANAAMIPGQAGQTAVAQLNAQGAQMGGQRAIQTAQDQQAIASQQLGPAMTQELGRMANDWTNMTAQIVQVMSKAADSLNNDLVKLATGQYKKGDVGRTLIGAGQGLVKTGLQGAEGYLMKALHLGGAAKADGSQASPYYVIVKAGAQAAAGFGLSSPTNTATVGMKDLVPGGSFIQPFIGGSPAASSTATSQGGGGGAAGGILGGLLGKIPGLGAGSSWGGLLSAILPKFADGGDILANRPSIIGENGPEIFTPRSAGTISPNSALGGSSGHTFNIDARGSNDPAAIHAAVMRAAPHIVAASMQAQHSSAKRSPHGK